MAKFPRDEMSIIALAQTMIGGLQGNPTDFPSPPVSPADLAAQLTEYQQFCNQITAANTTAKELHVEKDNNLAATEQMMHMIINYAEMIAQGSETVLNKIGWGNAAPPSPMTPPGQCGMLEIVDQGDGWVKVNWKSPSDGGKPAAYRVLRSEDGGAFSEVGSDTRSNCTLVNQPSGKKLTYQVVAFNKAGEGMASNTVSLYL